MAANLDGQLVVAISSRALFDLEEENRVFEQADDRAYMKLQLDRLEHPAKPGVAFSLVKKLLAFNTDVKRVEVVMLSRNDPVSGLRIFRSAEVNKLPLERGVFTKGRAPYDYLRSLQANLFLSANPQDVRAALNAGFAAATVATHAVHAKNTYPNEVRIAFDGDAVLFSDQAERVFQKDGLDAFQKHERKLAGKPLPPGPFMPLLKALHRLQQAGTPHIRIRTALVTARGLATADRAIRTLMDWNIEVDEAMFLGGLAKSEFLREFEPDFFFDDQTGHVDAAAQHVPAGHVASGVSNP
ncbi:5'-nucleotidase [Polaromonas sp. SM01]|uniref:5'-nucleotidase n=1 Tax=Polaromonas sp. SM01 TaxID=3085630 RepID=UPI002981BF30|nr:5'-nucleotidase [Polaromonas sp. SM01]MDW5444140.1 5'-nucleotidase [Polaromonas sp. SM01]